MTYTFSFKICLLILFEWKITLLIVPIFSEQPTCVQIRAVYSKLKKCKIIEVTIVQLMLWSWSLPDWIVVRYARLVVFFDSREATVCSFPLDSRVRKYGGTFLALFNRKKYRVWRAHIITVHTTIKVARPWKHPIFLRVTECLLFSICCLVCC